MRIVSLVPSLTESVAATAPGDLVGATDWCTRPAGLDVVRIGGTKNPDVAAILGLAPDLVLANEEENRAVDLDALRAGGAPVLVTQIRSVAEAFPALATMLAECGLGRPGWLDAAEAAWDGVVPGPPVRAVVPIWRRPWMVLGRDTFAGDVLARFGVVNCFADDPERYPRVELSALVAGVAGAAGPAGVVGPAAELVVLPDEPYAFSPSDGPECFPGQRVALVSGRHLTWYGPSLVEAPRVLAAQLAARSDRVW